MDSMLCRKLVSISESYLFQRLQTILFAFFSFVGLIRNKYVVGSSHSMVSGIAYSFGCSYGDCGVIYPLIFHNVPLNSTMTSLEFAPF